MFIEDGNQKNGAATVSAAQRLNVSAKSNSRAFYISRDELRAFKASFPGSFAVGEHVAYIKNTSSDRLLIVDFIKCGALNAARWVAFFCTGTAAAGETITPTNLNAGVGIPAEATCMAGGTAITGLTVGEVIGTARHPASSESTLEVDNALILGPNRAMVIEYDTGSTGVGDVEMGFHFETIGAT